MKRLIPGVSEWASSDVQCWVSNEVSIRYLCGLCGCEPALSALTLLLKGCESATWYSGACWTPPWLQHTCWSYRGSRRGAGGSGGLRHHHQRYQSPAFQRRGDAGPFWGHVWHNGSPLTLSVTVSYPNWAKGAPRAVCRASLARFCLFDSLEPDSNSEFCCYLKADAPLVRRASTSEAGEAPLCACLNRCCRPGRRFCSDAQYIQSTGNTHICHFQTSGTSFNGPSFTAQQLNRKVFVPFVHS